MPRPSRIHASTQRDRLREVHRRQLPSGQHHVAPADQAVGVELHAARPAASQTCGGRRPLGEHAGESVEYTQLADDPLAIRRANARVEKGHLLPSHDRQARAEKLPPASLRDWTLAAKSFSIAFTSARRKHSRNSCSTWPVCSNDAGVTNCLESINALVEERCAKVDRWQNSSQRHRWLATALVDIEPRLRKVMGYRHLPKLRDALQRELKIDTTTSKKEAA